MEDISHYYTQTETRGEFIDGLSGFFANSARYPNDKVNEQNLDIYHEHFLECADRFVKDARSRVVMKEKINQSWEHMRMGDRHNAVRVLQQAQWVIEAPGNYGDRCDNP